MGRRRRSLSTEGVCAPAGPGSSFPPSKRGNVTAAVYHPAGTSAIVFGDRGHIVLPDPWIPQSDRQALETGYTIHRDSQAPETVTIKTEMATYAIEAELVADTLPATEAAWPAMSWDETVGTMRVLDAWLPAIRS